MKKENLSTIKKLLIHQARQRHGTKLTPCGNTNWSKAFHLIEIKGSVYIYFWYNVKEFTHTVKKEIKLTDLFSNEEISAKYSNSFFDEII